MDANPSFWAPVQKWLTFTIAGLILVLLPFIVLIRGAVFFHIQYHWKPWSAIIGGILFSTLIWFGYFVVTYVYIYGVQWRRRILAIGFVVPLLMVLLYVVPGLQKLPANHAKYTTVKATYTNLHPILRLGLSSILWIDKDLLVTDAQRLPDDYERMGLAKKHYSLHFEQSNGFVHAIDIRVNGRSSLRNYLIQTYFNLMGFNTLRHVGTADHLHISLMSHDRPGAI